MAPGTPLGLYVLESLLGVGGMGDVYRAHDARLIRRAAIKILSPELATADRLFQLRTGSACRVAEPPEHFHHPRCWSSIRTTLRR